MNTLYFIRVLLNCKTNMNSGIITIFYATNLKNSQAFTWLLLKVVKLLIFSKKDHHKVPSRIQDSDYLNNVVFYPIEYIITATDEIAVIGLYSDTRG